MIIRKPFTETEEELKKRLEPEQYSVCRVGGTEPAFSGRFIKGRRQGIYRCSICGNPLFPSRAKFDFGTGWPSFDDALPGSVDFAPDESFGMKRIEVLCANCGSHLGHIFDDGPTATGKRYCVNSVCLEFEEKSA